MSKHLPKSVQVTDDVYPIIVVERLGEAGHFDPKTARIKLRKDNRTELRYVARHEIFHAAVWKTVQDKIEKKLGVKVAYDVEELFADETIPVYLAALESAGFIKILR